MPSPRPQHPILLVVIDGWGVGPDGPANAVSLAAPETMGRLVREFPSTTLDASGPAVGLPEGQMGNSEVGHLNIGAGRIVDQELVRITRTAREGRMGTVPALHGLFERVRRDAKALHVVGLLGPGGVHSHEDHLHAVLEAAARAGVPRVWVHHVLDGRDTPPQSALDFVGRAQARIDGLPRTRVASVSGRYWTMDRDRRWDRTERSYRMLTELQGHRSPDATSAVRAGYERGETDEFIAPTVVGSPEPIREGDGVLVYNFRPDRVRQIVRALVDPAFDGFPRRPMGLRVVSMTLYDRSFDALGVAIAFPPEHPQRTLGELYASWGLRQLRIAETEKYAHVTYFFSGGREDPFALEERLLVPSPKVPTYDLKPEMSAREITAGLEERLARSRYDLVVLNFANPDMVGHTGRLEPTIAAVRVVDECIGRLVEAGRKHGYLVAITADHGNAECMVDPQGRPLTAHTTNPVPLVLVQGGLRGQRLSPGGRLCDVAPTLLAAVGVDPPPEMTGRSLLAVKKALK